MVLLLLLLQIDKVLSSAIDRGTTCLDNKFQDDLYDAVDIKRVSPIMIYLIF